MVRETLVTAMVTLLLVLLAALVGCDGANTAAGTGNGTSANADNRGPAPRMPTYLPNTNRRMNNNQPVNQPDPEPDPADEVPRPEITIDVADEVEPWSTVPVTVTIRNVAEVGILVYDVVVTTNGGREPVLQVNLVQSRPCEALPDGGLVIRAGWLVEDIGPEARMPSPPRWHWKGDRQITTAMVLAPGESHSWSGSFVAEYQIGDRLLAQINCRPLFDEDLKWLLQAGAPSMTFGHKPAAPPGASGPDPLGPATGSKWVETVSVEVPFHPVTALPTTSGPALDIRAAGNGTGGDDPLAFEPPGIRADDALVIYTFGGNLDDFAIMSPGRVGNVVPFTIKPYEWDIDEAFAKVGLTNDGTVPFTRAVDAGMWAILDQAALDGAGVTHVVSPDAHVKIVGQALDMIDALNRLDRVAVELFRGAPDDDPGGLLAWFAQAGFEIERALRPGSGWTGSVIVDPARLADFAMGLDDLGLRMDGARALPYR